MPPARTGKKTERKALVARLWGMLRASLAPASIAELPEPGTDRWRLLNPPLTIALDETLYERANDHRVFVRLRLQNGSHRAVAIRLERASDAKPCQPLDDVLANALLTAHRAGLLTEVPPLGRIDAWLPCDGDPVELEAAAHCHEAVRIALRGRVLAVSGDRAWELRLPRSSELVLPAPVRWAELPDDAPVVD